MGAPFACRCLIGQCRLVPAGQRLAPHQSVFRWASTAEISLHGGLGAVSEAARKQLDLRPAQTLLPFAHAMQPAIRSGPAPPTRRQVAGNRNIELETGRSLQTCTRCADALSLGPVKRRSANYDKRRYRRASLNQSWDGVDSSSRGTRSDRKWVDALLPRASALLMSRPQQSTPAR